MDAGVVEAIKTIVYPLLLSMVRITALFMVVPFYATQFIQGVPRNATLISFSLILVPMVIPMMPAESLSIIELGGIIIKEVLIGVILGYLAGSVFWIAQNIGFLIDNQRGATMASVFDPLTGNDTSPFGLLFGRLMVAFFFVGGGFISLLAVVYGSYEIWPIFSYIPNFKPHFALFFLQYADHIIRQTFVLAAPIVILVFLTEFGFGLINRFAPQLNVFFLSMPVKSAVGLFMLVIYLKYLFSFLQREWVRYEYVIETFKTTLL